MTLGGFRKRVMSLEGRTGSPTTKKECEETLLVLQILGSDDLACDLYHYALLVTAKVGCLHHRHGICDACVTGSPPVQQAWNAYRERMETVRKQEMTGK